MKYFLIALCAASFALQAASPQEQQREQQRIALEQKRYERRYRASVDNKNSNFRTRKKATANKKALKNFCDHR